jgi:hypothetical protein
VSDEEKKFYKLSTEIAGSVFSVSVLLLLLLHAAAVAVVVVAAVVVLPNVIAGQSVIRLFTAVIYECS